MKLVQIRPGKSVKVSDTLLEKAARAFEVVALSPSQLKALASAERHHSVLIGKMGTAPTASRRPASVRIAKTVRARIGRVGPDVKLESVGIKISRKLKVPA